MYICAYVYTVHLYAHYLYKCSYVLTYFCCACVHVPRPPEMVKEGSDCSSTPQHDLYDLDELDLGWLESLQKRKYNGMYCLHCVCIHTYVCTRM